MNTEYEKVYDGVVKAPGAKMDVKAFEEAFKELRLQGFGGAAELLAVVKDVKDGLEGYFNHCDEDNDGSIVLEEFVKYCGNMMGRSRRVAIKFMKNEDQYLRELSMHKGLEPQYVVSLLDGPNDDDFKEAVKNFCIQKVFSVQQKVVRNTSLPLKDFKHCIVMPAADRTLDAIFRSERPDIIHVRAIMEEIAKALKHLHDDKKIIHGDLKMLNILRVDGRIRLIDFDAACTVGTKAGCKFSSGVLPPEMFARLTVQQSEQFTTYWKGMFTTSQLTSTDKVELWDKIKPRMAADGKLIVVKTFAMDDNNTPIVAGLPYENDLVKASVAIDMWAFGVLLYYLVSASPLLSVNRDEDLLDKDFARILEWAENGMFQKMIEAQVRPKDSSAADLLLKLLDPNPDLRWNIDSVLESDFFKHSDVGATRQLIMSLDEKMSSVLEIVTETNKNVKTVLVKLDKISDQIEDALECQRRGFEAILQQAERFHKDDKDYFKAQDAKLDAQFELLKTMDEKIDGLSDQLTKGFLKVEATFDRVTATITAELLSSVEKQTTMMAEFDSFHDKLSKMDAASFDTNAIKELMKDSMSSMSQDIKQQLEDSFAQVMEDKANGSDGDPSQQDKLDYLIKMVESTKDQVNGMKKDVEDLNALSTTLSELPTGSTEKYIMPRTFILVPVGNESEPISTSASPVATATAATVTAPEETKKSRFGLPDFGIKKAVATAGKSVVGQGIGLALEKGKKALTKACRGAYRLCWKTLRVQFICPVTMQPIPMVGPEGCLITMPTDFLIYSAKALHYGMIILKIAMATQGLGAVVPDLSGIIPVNLGMDIKQFASEYTELHGEATAIMDHLKLDNLKLDESTPGGQVLVVAEGAATDKAQAEVARLRNQFAEQFKGMAEGDGTTEVLAIYKLIAEGRKQTLASALQSSWQPKDGQGKAWGMEKAHPSDGQPGQVIWASEEGAIRLRMLKEQGGGLDALNPKADVNRDTVKTSSTATEQAISAANSLAKSAGINLVAIKQRCAEEYGISPDAVMSVVTNPLFSQIVFLVASKKNKDNKEKAANISEGLIHKDVQDSSGLTSDKLSALRDLLLSGGNDWSSLDHLAAVALDKSGVMEAKALWTLAKRSTSLKITAIERRTVKECGFRSGDVEAIFVAAVDSPVFKSAIEALISGNSDGAAFRQFKGNEFAALVDGIAEKTGISLPEIEMVLSALITSDLTKLQPLATGTQASTPVEERGLKVLWALVERFKIVPVDEIERWAKKCGLRPVDVESIFIVAMSDAVFKVTICKLMNNDRSGVTQQGLTFLLHFVETKIGKPPNTINAVINAILTGSVAKLEEVAKNAGKVVVGDHGPKALWALAKQATSLKISAIERRAEEHGIKPGEVETLFLAAASDYAFIDAMRELMNNQPGLAKDLVQGSAFESLVTVVADKTGVLPAKVKAVLTALLTMDLAALEALASGSVTPSVSPRGGRVAGLREEVTSGGASVLHEALKGKEVLLQQKEVAMQTALQENERLLQQKDEVLKQNERLLQQKDEAMKAALLQKDEMVQLLKSQLEEAKRK